MDNTIEKELDKEKEKLRKLKRLVLILFVASAAGGIMIMFAEYVFFELFWQ
jgi:hypothetical protein